MGLSSPPSSGASGAGLGPETWLCPFPNSPSPCSLSLPPARECVCITRTTAFAPAPLQVGCRHPITMATKLGHFLWAWGSAGDGKADHACHACAFMSGHVAVHAMCGSGPVCTCGGGPACVLLRGSELWVCPHAWGPGKYVPSVWHVQCNHRAQACLHACTNSQGLASGSGLWLLCAQGLQQVMVSPGSFRGLGAGSSPSSVPDCWVT